MDIKSINKLIDDLKDNLGDALLFSDISSFKIGSSVASYNGDPKLASLVNRFSKYLEDMVVKAGVGDSYNYYVAEATGNGITTLMYVLQANGYSWAILTDAGQISMGLMMVGVIPDCLDGLRKATK